MPPKKKKAPDADAAPPPPAADGAVEESNERIIPGANDWEPAKIMIKPREQLPLTDKELQEEFTQVWRADNPEAPKTIVRFSHKEKCFKLDPSIDQSEIHFAQEGCLLWTASDEAKKQAEREADEKAAAAKEAEKKKEAGETEEDASNLRNQFNFSERASQTLNNALRDRGTMTEPPPSVEYSSQCTQWEMYDAYIEDIERKKEQEGKKNKKGDKGATSTKKKQQEGGSDDIVHSSAMAHAAKILERMANQNTFADVTEDFKFWEDQSDLYRDEGTLLPLWR
jgi:dynein intermediate chain 1